MEVLNYYAPMLITDGGSINPSALQYIQDNDDLNMNEFYLKLKIYISNIPKMR